MVILRWWNSCKKSLIKRMACRVVVVRLFKSSRRLIGQSNVNARFVLRFDPPPLTSISYHLYHVALRYELHATHSDNFANANLTWGPDSDFRGDERKRIPREREWVHQVLPGLAFHPLAGFSFLPPPFIVPSPNRRRKLVLFPSSSQDVLIYILAPHGKEIRPWPGNEITPWILTDPPPLQSVPW